MSNLDDAVKLMETVEGPFLDYTARAHAINQERHICARLCAQKVQQDLIDEAREWAEKYTAETTRLEELWARNDEHRDDPYKWVGFHP